MSSDKTSGIGGPKPNFPMGPVGPVRRAPSPDQADQGVEKVEELNAIADVADFSSAARPEGAAKPVKLGVTGMLKPPAPLHVAALQEANYDPAAAPKDLAPGAFQYIVSQLS